jgi:hypothetical protein
MYVYSKALELQIEVICIHDNSHSAIKEHSTVPYDEKETGNEEMNPPLFEHAPYAPF